jgi:NADPH-dependent 2,4-dienoyl-CoA reductase/sulfur reductase-like enzyme
VTVLVVGASVAGIRTVQALRQVGFSGGITMVGEELHHPYDKPPLSKELLAAGATEAIVPLLTVEELADLDVDLRLGVRATRLDPAARVVETADGQRLPYTTLVIATGVQPRTLPGTDGVPGVHTIRTADDVLALRRQLATRPTVVVVGAGFIGAEFASAARAYGCPVTVVEAQDVPMAHILGPRVGGLLAELHREHGVRVVTGARFDHVEQGPDGAVRGVALADGRVEPADLVVVGIGARPATDWLTGSGLPIDDGVECDEHLAVVGHPGVYAAGDVARWPHALYGSPLRIEHWTNANEHGALVAASIAGTPPPRPQVPYVWSDQYGHRIQIVGRPSDGVLAHCSGGASDKLVAVYTADGGPVVGAVVVDDPRALLKLRRAVAARTPLADLDLVPSGALTGS